MGNVVFKVYKGWNVVDADGGGVLGVVDLDEDDAVAVAVVVNVLQRVQDLGGLQIVGVV